MEGMNGLELAKQVHQKDLAFRSSSLPVMVRLTAGKDVNACLQKEQLFPALLEKIKLYLGESELRKDQCIQLTRVRRPQ